MKRFKQLAAKAVLGLAPFGGVVGVVSLAAPNEAHAVPYHYYTPHYHAPHYHAPSVHYHRTYHRDYDHWTPRQGWHSHGHYHYQPHYAPGHWHW